MDEHQRKGTLIRARDRAIATAAELAANVRYYDDLLAKDRDGLVELRADIEHLNALLDRPDACPHCGATDANPLTAGLGCTNDWHAQ